MADEPSQPRQSFSESPDPGDAFRGRGSLDYMLRTTQQGQFQLNAMADAKANIIITVASIVFSLMLTRMQSGPWMWPMLTVCLFSGAAAVTAILTVLPADTNPAHAPKPGTDRFNLLFFGHFSQLSRNEFIDRIADATERDDGLYSTLCTDIHELGSLLARRKYRRLRMAYLFMIVGVLMGGAEAAAIAAMGLG